MCVSRCMTDRETVWSPRSGRRCHCCPERMSRWASRSRTASITCCQEPEPTSRSRSSAMTWRCCAAWSQVQAAMARVDGVVDLSTEMQTDIPTLRVKVDPERAARHGLPTGVVTEALHTARVGRVVGQVLEGHVAFPLLVRYARDE